MRLFFRGADMDKKGLPAGLDRRSFVSGLAAGAGLGLADQALAVNSDTHSLNLNDPAKNLEALIKLRADVSGAETLTGIPGEVWAWVPGEGNYLLFSSYGIGATRAEQVETGWRLYHREITYFTDPKSGEILQHWDNPFTGRRVEVQHVQEESLNQLLEFAAGPRKYAVVEDDLVFSDSAFQIMDADMSRASYPLHSQHDKFQTAELSGIKGRVSEIMNPEVTSVACSTAWTRLGQWMPFMEMGNRPGVMVYHNHAFKFRDGADQLPSNIRDYTVSHYPQFLVSPSQWSEQPNRKTAVAGARELIDRRVAGETPAGSVF